MSSAYDQAFSRTDVGTFEIKPLPAARLISSKRDGRYFEQNRGLFSTLFGYIRARNIPMTTPVEADIQAGVMYFYVGDGVDASALDNTEEVSVHERPERLVASHGLRGSYSEKNFSDAAQALHNWLSEHENYEIAGDAHGVFWNGPYVPGIFKRFEVHIPVRPIVD